MDFSGSEFKQLWVVWNVFCTDKFYNKGFSSKLAIAKVADASLNPRRSTILFIDSLIDLGIIKYASEGKLVIDRDRFIEFVNLNSTYLSIKQFIKDEDSTIFFE